MRQLKQLEQYKFKIQYILDKDNNKANALNKRSNYIKTKKLFNYNIFKINKNKLLLANKYKLNIILQIFRNNKEEFLSNKERKTSNIYQQNR